MTIQRCAGCVRMSGACARWIALAAGAARAAARPERLDVIRLPNSMAEQRPRGWKHALLYNIGSFGRGSVLEDEDWQRLARGQNSARFFGDKLWISLGRTAKPRSGSGIGHRRSEGAEKDRTNHAAAEGSCLVPNFFPFRIMRCACAG